MSEMSNRTVSETNVFLEPFHFMDNGLNFDTMSVDSTESLETSISACSPDNISRWDQDFVQDQGRSILTIQRFNFAFNI